MELIGLLGSLIGAMMQPSPPTPPPPPPPIPQPDKNDPVAQNNMIQAQQRAMATRGRRGTNLSQGGGGGNAIGTFTNTSLGQ